MTKPFRFALQTSNAPDARAWRERARRCEDLGYSTLYIPDHLGDQWGPLVALTVAAEATTTLNVGSLVLDNDYRHPVFLAKEAATLDIVSEGRFEFGLGAGWMKSDYDQAGLSYDEPRERVDRMEEGLAVLKALWAGEAASFEGRHYQVTGAPGQPRPHTPGGPKLVIGGGSKRVLSIAAREAAVVGVNPSLRAGYVGPEVAKESVADKFDQRIAWVRAAAGDRFADLELQMLTFIVSVGGDADQMAAALAPTFGVSPEEAKEVPMALIGSVEEICETIQARRERYGFNYWVVHDAEFEDFAPVVARLAGT